MYYDGEYKEDDATIETCLPLEKMTDVSNIKSRILTGGKAVTLIHKGAYELLGDSYKKIFDHINENNLTILPPTREIYVKGPGIIFSGNPKNYITEIQIFFSN
jgi:effector-binding domain-containing protein